MKKYINLLLTCSFIFCTTNGIGQQLEKKSTVKISENQLKSLVETLRKYKIQHSIVNDSIKKSSVLVLENEKVDTLNSTLVLKNNFESKTNEKHSAYLNTLTSEKSLTIKNNTNSNSNLKKKEVLVNPDELLNLQNEIKELKTVINSLVINQNKANTIERNKTETIKETKIIHQNNNIPKPIISETFIHKTDTLFIIENSVNSKTLDSILFLKLQEKITLFESKLKESDSILNSLVKSNIEKSNTNIVSIVEKKPVKEHFNDVFFENNEFELNINNQNMLVGLVNLAATNKSNHIYLKGYASNIGNSNYNQKLSLKRTESVKNYLIKKGIEADRISSNFFGIDHNESNEAKARRVEIVIFKN